MSFTVTGWNLADGLSDAARADKIVDHIVRLDTDVAVFPEAYAAEKAADISQSIGLLRHAGYQVEHVPYDDGLDYPKDHGLVAISRLPAEFEVVKLATRNSLAVTITDSEVGGSVFVLGAHYDYTSEEIRQQQAADSAALLAQRNLPGVLAGDLNALHRAAWLARIMRSRPVRQFGKALPRGEFLDQVRNLSGMSLGTTLAVLEAAGLKDVDPVSQATALGKLQIAQLDHFFYNAALRWTSFRVESSKKLSDHRPIQATFSVID